MNFIFFLKGLLIGFLMAAPVGPIGILCIRRTLTEGRMVGLVSGLGIATADAIYGCITGLGLTFISNFLIRQQIVLQVIGGSFLCYLGLRILLARHVEMAITKKRTQLVGSFTSTFFLTLTHPMTIFIFLAIFSGLGMAEIPGHLPIMTLVLGIFIGSTLWWVILTTAISLLRASFSAQGVLWVNRISGVLITGFGIAILLNFFLR